jgi:hypothetical protein
VAPRHGGLIQANASHFKRRTVPTVYSWFQKPIDRAQFFVVRKALTHDRYTNIDMVNAHPCILSQLFKKHNLECPRLNEYIANRKEHLENVMGIIDDTVTALLEDMSKNRKVKSEHTRKSSSLRRDAETKRRRNFFG